MNSPRMNTAWSRCWGSTPYADLIRRMWGPNAKQDNQILRVNMANIRRKIEKDPAHPRYIFTETGIGYRMADK